VLAVVNDNLAIDNNIVNAHWELPWIMTRCQCVYRIWVKNNHISFVPVAQDATVT
jgi:hypothetical protein